MSAGPLGGNLSTSPPTEAGVRPVPTTPGALADAIASAAGNHDVRKQLWEALVARIGWTDATSLWAEATRAVDARRRGDWTPGDLSLGGLTAALLQFVRAAGIGDADFFRGEVRWGSSAYDADLFFHLADGDVAAAVGKAFGLVDAPVEVPDRGQVHHHYRGRWEGYRVDMVWVDVDPPAADPEPAPADVEPPVEAPPAGGASPE